MKKLLLILFLSFASSTIYAQIKPWTIGQQETANGESYSYEIDEIPGAVSYEWSIEGTAGAVIWPYPWNERWIDVTYSTPGYCHLYCTVTLDNNTVVVYQYDLGVAPY